MNRPKLLLDTNVFRQLAYGKFPDLENRLLDIAKIQDPPILWTCDIVHQELFAHLIPEETHSFAHFRSAIDWIDKLCGNRGLAKGHPDPLRAALYVSPCSDSREPLVALNRLRRQIIKASELEALPSNVLHFLATVHDGSEALRAEWVKSRQDMGDKLRGRMRLVENDRLPGDAIDRKLIPLAIEIMTETFRSLADTEIHGPLRSEADFQDRLREFLHYEAALLLKIGNKYEYNFAKNRNDFFDHLLCSYPAAGYTIVTEDRKLRAALDLGKCPAPRIVDLRNGIRIAEDAVAQ